MSDDDEAPHAPRCRRPAAALLPASLTAAALVAAPFAGSTTGPLSPTVLQAPAPPTHAYDVLAGAGEGIAAAAAREVSPAAPPGPRSPRGPRSGRAAST